MVRLSVKKMLNSSYIYIVLICFVLAVPVGYYGINKWLESFAYKTPMFWWVYPLAAILCIEYHQIKDTHKRNNDRQKAEYRDQATQILFLMI